mmetsp:Transcript_108338/g.302058  ORF Transcript_108338/g.302058 Transcript_108338/m.302058 type:complete len:260 (+) Transcript_108338:2309-3088(+)
MHDAHLLVNRYQLAQVLHATLLYDLDSHGLELWVLRPEGHGFHAPVVVNAELGHEGEVTNTSPAFVVDCWSFLEIPVLLWDALEQPARHVPHELLPSNLHLAAKLLLRVLYLFRGVLLSLAKLLVELDKLLRLEFSPVYRHQRHVLHHRLALVKADEVVRPMLDVLVLCLRQQLTACNVADRSCHGLSAVRGALRVQRLRRPVILVQWPRDEHHDERRRVGVSAEGVGTLQGLILHLETDLHDEDGSSPRGTDVCPKEV